MKRKGLAIFAALTAMFIMSTAKKSSATAAAGSGYRVLDYTYNCVGSGGNCLPTVVVSK